MRQPDSVNRVVRRLGVALALVAAQLPTVAEAQPAGYPTKPIRVIVPYPGGGPTEIALRIIAPRLIETMGRPIVIDNRGGAGSRIGTELVARAPPDGYTLLYTSASLTASVSQFKKLPYDVVADFAPITQVDSSSGNLLVVHPSFPAHSVKALIALAKARPNEINYASGGIGSSPHITTALFAAMAGIRLMHVPYKGTAGGLNDVLGGRIELMAASASFALPHIKQGRLRALGIAGQRRLSALPDVPTISEAGVTGYNVASWHGMWFPAGVPIEIVHRVRAEVVKALAEPGVRKRLADSFVVPVGSSPEEFAEFIRKEIALQASIMKTIGLEPE